MKIFYRTKLKKNYENISRIINEKTNFLHNLPKIKRNGLKIIKDSESEIILENILKINEFKRDYSSLSPSSGFRGKIMPIKIHFLQGVKYPIEKKIKNSNSYCKTKNPQFGKLPIINNNNKYQPKYKKIKFANINKNKLSIIDKNIIENRDIFSNKI